MFWLKCSKNRASDGPAVYVCNSDEFRGWQIGRSLEAQFCVWYTYVSAGYSARVSIGHS